MLSHKKPIMGPPPSEIYFESLETTQIKKKKMPPLTHKDSTTAESYGLHHNIVSKHMKIPLPQ